MSLNLGELPLRAARRHSNAIAIRMGEQGMDYATLSAQIQACAHALRADGVGPGHHIGLMMPNVPAFSITYFAILCCGATVTPLNVLLVEEELIYHLKDCDASALVAWSGFSKVASGAVAQLYGLKHFEWAAPDMVGNSAGAKDLATLSAQYSGQTFEAHATSPDDTAVILYTSGTTGQPKGAELSHFNMADNARYCAERLLQSEPNTLKSLGPGDCALATLPMFHSFGQTVIQNAFLSAGACISMLPRFDPAAAAGLIQAHSITLFAGVPTMYMALLNHPDIQTQQLASLQFALSGGAAMPIEVLHTFEKRFGVPIIEGYGLSETSPVACFNPLHGERKPGTVGPPIDSCDVRILSDNGEHLGNGETGEIAFRGTNVMKGYYNRPDATADVLSNGWFRTGDAGMLDEDGYLRIVDRIKDMIIRGGYNVYPREVEEKLYTHPDINEAAVIGIPHPNLGEEVMAVIALREGAELNHEELECFAREHLAAYKVPRMSAVMPSLPKGPTGKILKREIKQQILNELSDAAS